jgi:hypothetical protein
VLLSHKKYVYFDGAKKGNSYGFREFYGLGLWQAIIFKILYAFDYKI